MDSLDGKTALVTGSSRGIGRAVALKLAARGAKIVVNYRSRADKAQEVVDRVESSGGEALAVQADVGKRDDAGRLAAEAMSRFGSLEIVVNNAGIWRPSKVEEVEPDVLDRLISTNLKSTFYVTGAAVPGMKGSGWGRIISVSSVIGVTGYPGDSMYASTKSALFGFTKSIAKELARFNITANAVVPGFIETDMQEDIGEDVRSRILRTIPMRRWGKAEEVAELVTFLCTGGSYITGQLFTVDGGYTI